MSDESKSDAGKSGYVFGRRYAWYALFLLTLVSAFNLIDRMIVTILAGHIKADLGLSDSELGLLYGTFFAIFYALFGIPLGRLSDTWVRTRLLPIGLAAWSLMTMMSGLANNMWQFALTRVGVGIGEASAGPCATSLLSDYFPKEMRGTALALYSCGIPIGVGFSLGVGGIIVETWNSWYPAGNFPLGIKGWQAALMAVGLPGFVLAAFVAKLKEPPRGISDGMVQPADPHPFRKSWKELMAVVPPLIYFNFAALKVPRRVWLLNLLVLVVLIGMVIFMGWFTHNLVPPEKSRIYAQWGMMKITSHTVQWASLGFGLYCVFSWAQSLKRHDLPAFRLIWGSPAIIAVVLAGALFMTITNGLMAWAPLFAVTQYNETLATVGIKFGATSATAGLIGTALGGIIGDRLQKKSPRGRLYVTLVAMVLPAPLAWLTFSQTTLNAYLACFSLLSVTTTAWLPGMLSTIQDLVLPRMRGIVFATFYLGMTIIGLGTGPYLAGLGSDITGDLGTGILCLYLLAPLVWVTMFFAIRHVDEAQRSKTERAIAAGEVL